MRNHAKGYQNLEAVAVNTPKNLLLVTFHATPCRRQPRKSNDEFSRYCVRCIGHRPHNAMRVTSELTLPRTAFILWYPSLLRAGATQLEYVANRCFSIFEQFRIFYLRRFVSMIVLCLRGIVKILL
jgi:hypothetical protein